jgi:hypothetical protein
MLVVFSITNGVNAAMTSTNYQINFDAISSGGTDFSSSTNFQLHDTLGEQGTGYSTSTNYLLHAGYRQTDADDLTPTLMLVIGAQENSTQTTYSALSLIGKTVTVADTSSYTTGSRIGVVENQGLSESAIVGSIIDITGSVITVDKWSGQTGTISTSPSGGNDYVYRLEGFTLDFNEFSQLGEAGLVMTEVSTNASNGYTLQIQSDGELQNAAGYAIHDVTDDVVTAGVNEYGAQIYGDNATSTGMDFALNTSYRDIQLSTTTADQERCGMIYKVSVGQATIAGNYQHTVRYLLTANF